MKTLRLIIILITLISTSAFADAPRKTISLNGIWDFDQTVMAFRPANFTRKIPVPGLVHLAIPKIEEYNKFFKQPDKSIDGGWERQLILTDYTPRYSWYRKKITISDDLKDLDAVLTIKKSQYVTQVFVNGIDLGNYIECYTPIDVAITRALKFGKENEILIKVADRFWLPSQAAGSIDKEKEHYIPGIWDDVLISFTNKIRVNRVLALPFLKEKKVTVKAKIWNLNRFSVPADPKMDKVNYLVKIYEKKSRKLIAETKGVVNILRDQIGELSVDIPMDNPHAWGPDDPFLYSAEITLLNGNKESDQVERAFGMRDFERRGKSFYLNDEKTYLRGSNITLQRFFEDPEASNLAWDKEWVKKVLIDIPKQMDWNSMRICVGIVPDFWYDLADEYGMLFQNEWLYWQMHGWDDQIKKEYTDWVWSDGSHPSIVIWDAINENRNQYIGTALIPELKLLDPTRIWDAGYMTADQMSGDDMDEPHTYQGRKKDGINKTPYPLGNLKFKPEIVKELEESTSAQLVNEYGWVWLWRDGTPSKLTTPIYDFYMGDKTTVDERRSFQAYWLQCETEWMRSNKSVAGLLAFCLLTNNYGYTGDWFTGHIKDLNPSPTLYWFKHCFAETNIFINVTDERFAKDQPIHNLGEVLSFNFRGVNDANQIKKGSLTVKLLNSKGVSVYSDKIAVTLPAADRVDIPYSFILPKVTDGYLLLTEFTEEGSREKKLSRRYIKVGKQYQYKFFEMPVPANFINYATK
ncbi:beta-glycosidase [Pedobacter psychrophilus]|uniref:Beta-glycosidase n=1 Tax=Pedobacter psychrophilus TaxID=1826909 RepID=A0A179DH39_9SPHI|nr:glycoside hydrolase family 2 TIM barrel-domain containing protein [Pedobacter psychrophilus]OAQ40341.1 beta-glycosidase [Pedobacter psychrophilus]